MNETKSETRQVAIMITCVECGHETWVKGLQFNVMCDLAESNFDCEGCGRQLETGESV